MRRCALVIRRLLAAGCAAAALVAGTADAQEAAAGAASPETAEEALRAGEAAARRGDRAEAVLHFERALRAREAQLGPRDPTTLEAMGRLVQALRRQGRPKDALPLAERAAALRTETLGPRHPDALDSRSDLASILGDLGRHPEQAALNEQVLAARTEVLGPRHMGTLTSMNNLALSLALSGRHGEALALYQRLVPLCVEVLGERDPATLSVMNNLGDTLGRLGRHAEALAQNERVLQARTETLGPQHASTLNSMGNLAYTYTLLGRQREAVALNREVLRLRTQVLGARHPDTLFVMNNLAQSTLNLGHHAEAQALLEQVYRLRTEVLGERHPDTVLSLTELGRLQLQLGRYEEAAQLYERGVQLHRDALGEKHPNTLGFISLQAQVEQRRGNLARALALHEAVLKLQTETLGETHPRALLSLAALAGSHLELGQPAQALALQQKAWQLQAQTLGEDHHDTLASLDGLMRIQVALGNDAEALALGETLLAQRGRVLGERHPATLASVASLARVYARNGRRRDAVALAARYVEGAEWQRAQPGLSGDSRRSLFQTYAQAYRRFSIDSGRVDDLALGFRLAELSKGRTLLESMTARFAGRSGALPAAAQAALDDLNRQVAAHDLLIAQARSAEARVSLEAARNTLVREYEAQQAALKARHPKYAQLSTPQLVDATRLGGVVPSDAVAVSYVVLPDEAAGAWLVDGRGRPRFVDLGALPHLSDAVEALRRASAHERGLAGVRADDGQRAWRLTDGSYRWLDDAVSPPDGAQAVHDEAEIAAWLGARLLVPLHEALRGKPKWIIAPDGPLAQLPFELLRIDGGRRVLEAAELHYTQSLSVYALSRQRQREYRSLRRGLDLLAFGDPLYDAPAEPAATRKARLRALTVSSEDQLAATRFAWPALPGTALEVQAIRALLPRSRALLLHEASEAKLQELNQSGTLRDVRLLHFAVHGNLSASDPALSSLVLSQRDLVPGTDGHVTAAEWPGYELRSDLVVLSACETGLGRQLSGEGVMGLPFGLFLAGNVNTVLSLWPVLDSVTPLFMQKFYARIKAGQGAAHALHATKREMAADPRTRHPVNWAPFILVGAG